MIPYKMKILRYLMADKKSKTKDAREKTKLIIGPWSHQIAPWGRVMMGENGEYADRVFGKNSLLDIINMHTHWYDQRLKGINTGIDDEPPIKLLLWVKTFGDMKMNGH